MMTTCFGRVGAVLAPILVLLVAAAASARDPVGRDLVLSIQSGLARLGYAVGRADGVMGARTRGAILAFEDDNALPRSGRPSIELLAALERRFAGGGGGEDGGEGGDPPASVEAAVVTALPEVAAPTMPAGPGLANSRWLFDDGDDVRVVLLLRADGSVAGPTYARRFRWTFEDAQFVLAFENALGAWTRREGRLVGGERMEGTGTSSRDRQWRWTATRLP